MPGRGQTEGNSELVNERKAAEAEASTSTYLQVLGEGSLGSDGGAPTAFVSAMGRWLSVVPAHVERIRAGKTCFSLSFLEGGSRVLGDSPEIPGVWTALLPFLSISQAAWEMHTICWQPQASSNPQPAQQRSCWLGLPFYSWSSCLKGEPGGALELCRNKAAGIMQNGYWA